MPGVEKGFLATLRRLRYCVHSAKVLKLIRGLEVCENVKWIELVCNGMAAFDVENSCCWIVIKGLSLG